MKTTSILLALSLSFAASAQDIYDYTVFAKGHISAECGDFLGRSGARGNVTLRDFLVKDDASTGCRNGCPLESASEIRLTRGSIQDLTGYSCISGSKIFTEQTGARDYFYPSVNFDRIANQMDRLSERLANIASGANHTVLNLEACDVFLGKQLILDVQPGKLLVINLRGARFNFDRVGMKLINGATPGNIIWNFVDAQELVIKNAGTRQTIEGHEIGVPGMILAPRATLFGNTSRVTGAVYVNNFIGTGAALNCSGATSLQVNPMPLSVKLPCESGCGGGKGHKNF